MLPEGKNPHKGTLTAVTGESFDKLVYLTRGDTPKPEEVPGVEQRSPLIGPAETTDRNAEHLGIAA